MTVHFDPLSSPHLSSNLPNPDSYWAATTKHLSFSTLEGNLNADVVIIGAGYTGLSCAIHLAEQGYNNIHILEANTVGWGCSGRNAGFVLPGSGRLGYSQLIKRFGKNQALNLHQDYLAAIELLQQLNQKTQADIDQTENGYLKLAHSRAWFDKLKANAEYLASEFNYDVDFIDKNTLDEQFVAHQKAYGAIRYHNGFGVNPLKLVNSYAEYAKKLGVTIHTNSAVTDITSNNKQHTVYTKLGQIRCDTLVFSTNGYTTGQLNSPLKNRILPILTNVVVTRPLTKQEILSSNFKTQQVMMDTRELKYYYRLLPDNRLLFGGRGAISGKDANNGIYQQRLLQEIKSSFVGLDNISIDYNWIGWIAVAYDQMPHIFKTPDNMFYASGYCGSGLSFSAFAGKQLADLVSGKSINSPLYSALPKFPFAHFRRLGQRAFYQYGRLKDALS